MLEYFAGSLVMLLFWGLAYLFGRERRHEMLVASLVSMMLAFLEPIFVPAYWNPPTLFNLAATTGFDIESFIFCFATGGLAATIFEIAFPGSHVLMPARYRKSGILHYVAVGIGPIIFALLMLATSLNPMHAGIIAMLSAAAVATARRPDIAKKIVVGGVLFMAFYFVFFMGFEAVFPDYVQKVWNLASLTGVLVAGMPLEELLCALAQGMMWGSFYEHLFWYRLKE